MIQRSVLALLILSAGLYAQEFRATLSGTVTDASGGAIPNATVKAVNAAVNSTNETKTSGDGLYTIPLLQPGVYTIEVIADGFQTLKREAITLAVGQRVNLPIRLIVGQVDQEITVIGQQDIIDAGDANKGLVFDPTKTQEYPLNGRQSYMLLNLTPGVIFTQEQFGSSGFSGTRGWDVNSSYKFNGARGGNGNNVFMMNGTAISDGGSQWDFAPSVDAIQEFSAMTTVYDAQYGHEAGGVVNTVIKGGTNDWHGDIYDYFRNAKLDANNFGNNVAGAPKGNHQQNQFGGVFGGPIRKDKDFVFVSYEGWQEVIPFPGAGQNAIPLDMRDGQHFTKYGMSIFDPLTTRPCGSVPTEPCSGSNGSTYWRDPFPGNVIPQSRISPVATRILSYLPAPNSPGQGTAGLTSNYLNPTNTGRYWYNQPIVRWDHTFSDKDKFYALFSEFHGYEFRSTTTFPAPVATGNTDNNRTFTSLSADWTHVVSSTTIFDLKASYFRFTQLTPGYTAAAQVITPQSIGMTNMIHAPTVSSAAIPNINIGGFTGPLFGSGSFSWSPYNRWILTPSVTMSKGKHGLHFGFEYNYEARGNVAPGNAYGSFTFGSGLTQQATDHASTTNGGVDGFMGVASLLLGMPTSGNIDNNATTYFSRPYYAGYLQDDWKITDRLTLSLGARYEIQVAYLERYNRQGSQFDISVKNPLSDQILAVWNADKAAYDANPGAHLTAAGNFYPYPSPPAALMGVWRFAGVDGFPQRQHYTDFTTGAPRFGFAYRLGQKTVIRGGIGVFYQSDTATGNGNTGFSISTAYQSSFTNGQFPSACNNAISGTTGCASGVPTGPYSLVNPFPQGLATAVGPAAGLLANIGQSSTTNPLHYKTPRTYQYSLGVQRQLPWNMVIDVSFAGNYALYDRDSQNLGNIQELAGLNNQNTAIADAQFFSRSIANPFQGILPATVGLGSNATVSASTLLNNYPLWGGYTQADVADRYFRSDAGQLRFEKRSFSGKGSAGIVTWVLSYTFSKEYAMTCCTGVSWSWYYGETLNLSPDGKTASLTPYPQKPTSNLRYDFDSANKPQQLAFSGIWDLPIGKGRKFATGVTGGADKIVSGWRADWILTYISGSAVGLPQSINFCGDYTQYKDPVTGQYTGQTPNHWFNNNPSCYANFPSNSITGYLPQRFAGNVENPALPQLNAAISKETQFGERYRLQFKAESFNLTNTPIRGGPQSTSFTSPVFGVLPNSQNNFPRLVQLALKLYF
jgi:hypothetical protein